MSEISKLYDEVMAGVSEKTAADTSADQGPAFDKNFFEKVAEGEEQAVSVLNDFINEARAEGHSDEQIETAMTEAMGEAGYELQAETESETEGTSDFEQEKMSMYAAGSEQAVNDVLESDLAKTAGVTAEELAEYELGVAYGAGYGEARQELEERVQKIANVKKKSEAAKKALGLGSKFVEKMKGAGKRTGELIAGGGKHEFGPLVGQRAGNRALLSNIFGKSGMRGEALKSLGARAATAGGLGAAGYGGYRLVKKDKK